MPIFVLGASRSGTSVLLQALGEHPQILSIPGEAPFITSIGGAAYLFEFSDAREYYRNSLRYPLEYFYDSLRRLAFEYAAGRNYGLKLIIKGLLDGDHSYLNKRYWCAKTFPDIKVAKGLIKLYPAVRFLYIIRNGCDVVYSRIKFSGFSHQEFEKHCREWSQTVDKYDFLKNFECALRVRHEDLVDHPEQFFQGIFTFLRVKNHPGPCNYVTSNLLHPLDKPTQTVTSVKEAFRKRKPSYEAWTEEQREIFRRICGQKMEETGYNIRF